MLAGMSTRRRGTRWQAPPNWPPPPQGWTPPPGWEPDPAWGPAPSGWQFWIDGRVAGGRPPGAVRRAGPAAGVLRPPLAWGRRHPRLAVPLAILALLILIGTISNLVSPAPARLSTTVTPAGAPPLATDTATPAPPASSPPAPTSTSAPTVVAAPPKSAPRPSQEAVPTPLFITGAGGAVLPNRTLTPGEVFPSATGAQVCVPGYSRSVRNVTDSVRRGVFAAYHVDYALHSNYELDHLVPLELGGDNAAANLWPQPRTGPQASDVKDHLENHLHALVCAGRVPLAEAQQAMEGDWFAANAKYGRLPTTTPAPAPVYTPPPPVYTPPEQSAPPAPAGSEVYYASCADARAAGAAPLNQGSPGYRPGLDRDGDGIACE